MPTPLQSLGLWLRWGQAEPGGVKKRAGRAAVRRGGAGQAPAARSRALLLLGSRSQPLATRRCSCAGSGAAAAFYRLLMSLEHGGPGGPACWPMAARPPRPRGAGRGAPDSSSAPRVS